MAAVGYDKALVRLGVPTVRRCIKRLEKWRAKGQRIETPGRLLMHHLNREARAASPSVTSAPSRDSSWPRPGPLQKLWPKPGHAGFC